MIFSDVHKFCLLANPKCASSSLQKLVGDSHPAEDLIYRRKTIDECGGWMNQGWESPEYNHVAALYVYQHFIETGREWESYYVLATIRNPYIRMVSWYKWYLHLVEGDSLCSRFSQFFGRPIKNKFTKWLENIWLRRIREGVFFPPGVEHFAFDRSGNQLVTEIIRSEDLNAEWSRIRSKLKITNQSINQNEMIAVNTTNQRIPWQEYYTPLAKEIVEEVFQKDFEIGGYIFDIYK